MALLGNVGEDFTKTGKGGLTKFANALSFIPGVASIGNFFSKVPFIGHGINALIGYVDTAWEAGKWAFQGKFGSAATVLTAGVVSNTVNAIPGVSWWVNDILGVTMGTSAGTLARGATESAIKMLGMKPEVLNSYPAAIGSINTGAYVGGKDNFRDKIAAERGLTRAQMDARSDQAYVNMASGSNQLGA